MTETQTGSMKSDLDEHMTFDEIRYSQLWEDPRLLDGAKNIKQTDTILSIGSAGCNLLSMLRNKPKKIVALDMSPAQIALMELKFTGIKYLDHDDFLELIGIKDSSSRWNIFDKIKHNLSASCKTYFEHQRNLIDDGLINQGRLDKHIAHWASHELASLVSHKDIQKYLNAKNLKDQKDAFKLIATAEVEASYKKSFGRESLARSGRDPAQYRFVTMENLDSFQWNRFVHVATKVDISNNPFMEYFLCGKIRNISINQAYLQKEIFEELKTLVTRIEIVEQDLESYLSGVEDETFDFANLSDIFEYMSEEHSDNLFRLLAKKMTQNARLAYWNLYVDRKSPKNSGLKHLDELSESLYAKDRFWAYSAFHVEEKI